MTEAVVGLVLVVAGAFLVILAVVKVIAAIQSLWRKLHQWDRNLPPRMDHLISHGMKRTPYILKDPGHQPLPKIGQLVRMSRSTSRPFTFFEERHAAASHQRLWIKYEDFNGNITKREVDVYYPKEDDEYIFCWCRLKAEPRTFKRANILLWQFIEDTFEFNPLVERYFQEEGGRDRHDKIPWKRWLERQPRL